LGWVHYGAREGRPPTHIRGYGTAVHCESESAATSVDCDEDELRGDGRDDQRTSGVAVGHSHGDDRPHR